jgi:hypothetical protein
MASMLRPNGLVFSCRAREITFQNRSDLARSGRLHGRVSRLLEVWWTLTAEHSSALR